MKVQVDFDVCESNALCMGVMPEVFEVGDDDFLRLLRSDITPEEQQKALEAVRKCPRQAISLVP